MGTTIYIFSGLGADERIFQHIDFLDFSVVHIKWISPFDNETIEDYAKRIATQIQEPNPILLGVSFGGIMATEVAKFISTTKIILISSIKTKYEIPYYYKIVANLSLYKIMPASLLKSSNCVTHWFFGAESIDEKKLLQQILKDTDDKFLMWAIDKIVNWKNEIHHPNIYHIHGTSDKILSIKYVKCDIKIEKGSHLMVLNRASEINSILKKIFHHN